MKRLHGWRWALKCRLSKRETTSRQRRRARRAHAWVEQMFAGRSIAVTFARETKAAT